jgi:hypothetical protein
VTPNNIIRDQQQYRKELSTIVSYQPSVRYDGVSPHVRHRRESQAIEGRANSKRIKQYNTQLSGTVLGKRFPPNMERSYVPRCNHQASTCQVGHLEHFANQASVLHLDGIVYAIHGASLVSLQYQAGQRVFW